MDRQHTSRLDAEYRASLGLSNTTATTIATATIATATIATATIATATIASHY
jgi:hypothetical protein